MAAPAIEFADVGKRFSGRRPGEAQVEAVRAVSFSVAVGEVVSIIGPSGCGKSTLLNMGSGLYLPSSGAVRVDGQPVTGPQRKVAFMLQKDLLLPWRSIRENAELGLEILGTPAAERSTRARALLAKCHLSGFENHYPHQLSGGMRQRAALARTLAVDPLVLLMDEPFSALDAQTKMILQQDLSKTVAAEGKTAVFITHDLAEAVLLSDRVLVMSARPGTIVEEMRIELPDRESPMARRRHPEVSHYVSRLMELLHLGDMVDAEQI
jgi:NitT/TauT family transport system ATP-binding protein